MWITISTSSHPFLHTHSSTWCSSLPIRGYHRAAISTAVLFWATSSNGFQYNNCLQLMTSSVSTTASKHRTACMEEKAHLRTEWVLAKLLTRMMWIWVWVVEALWETRDTCIREDLWRSSNDAIVISLQLIVFSCSRFSQNVGAPLAILLQLFASCVQKEQTHMVENRRTQFCFCRIRPSAAFKCDYAHFHTTGSNTCHCSWNLHCL